MLPPGCPPPKSLITPAEAITRQTSITAEYVLFRKLSPGTPAKRTSSPARHEEIWQRTGPFQLLCGLDGDHGHGYLTETLSCCTQVLIC
ncbi:hypothetical protein JTE90_028334 [Oedothorax gibbosus]|uniref:Uncharacterized protein n=1 Tax=Oedothorax gibbosus TaxID=931172 RepID=A0AAV6V362_9ARAC|nr:hypothetical protein JTE90_028334 [Oedothorax gibbosus]